MSNSAEFSAFQTPEEAINAAKDAALRASFGHLNVGDGPSALSAWDDAFAILPEDALLRANLATLFAQKGAVTEAFALLDMAEELGAPQSTVSHFRAAIKGEVPENPDMEYVRDLFDRAAVKYNAGLEAAQNRGPVTIEMLLAVLEVPEDGSFRILDVGCGTGLCGAYLRPRASELVGVDISSAMLDLAKETGHYDHLSVADIATADTLPEGPFDIVTAGDVFVYFGALQGAFASVKSRLSEGGLFVFTVEAAAEETPPPGYWLQMSGRYKHTLDHLNRELEAVGLEIFKLAEIDQLRIENGQPVEAFGVIAKIKGSAGENKFGL